MQSAPVPLMRGTKNCPRGLFTECSALTDYAPEGGGGWALGRVRLGAPLPEEKENAGGASPSSSSSPSENRSVVVQGMPSRVAAGPFGGMTTSNSFRVFRSRCSYGEFPSPHP